MKMRYLDLITLILKSIPWPFFLIPVLAILYLAWIWIFDTKIYERGGRRFKFIRNLSIWKAATNYFPIKLKASQKVQLDPKQNYLFCGFPHGIFGTGYFFAFGTTAVGFEKLFPYHVPYILTLKQHYMVPVLRDLLLAVGCCSASAKSIKYLMSDNCGGNVAVLLVGGSEETFLSKPGNYRFVLKNRKGFVKQAIQNGCALVPLISFGEVDLFDQIYIPPNSLIGKLLHWIKDLTGIPIVFPIGSSLFGIPVLPNKTPINFLVGEPIRVEKKENPTAEEIDNLHKQFTKDLISLFERNKYKFIKNASNTLLEII